MHRPSDAPPKPGDRDGDGITDDVDKCPDEPEDKDGFQDEDGCPDLDNDADGIPDKDDKCPNEPEDKDGFQDEDGCPDPRQRQATASPTRSTSARTSPRTRTASRTTTAAPIPTTTRTAFLDKDDKCPNESGVAPDGCPKKYKLVVVTEKKIELKQTVFFDVQQGDDQAGRRSRCSTTSRRR